MLLVVSYDGSPDHVLFTYTYTSTLRIQVQWSHCFRLNVGLLKPSIPIYICAVYSCT